MRTFIKPSAMIFGAAMALGSITTAVSAEPIVGQWRSPDGGLVEIDNCGSAYCAVVIAGEHKGKAVGQMAGSGSDYSGTITDPRDDRTYEGTVTIRSDGSSLQMQGCALKIFCKTQTWTKA